MKRAFKLCCLLLLSQNLMAKNFSAEALRLSKASVFSSGYNGFISQKLQPQQDYETLLQKKDAVIEFKNILSSNSATIESKLYAVCGLWEKGLWQEINISENDRMRQVTVLTGDILRKVRFSEVFLRIKKQGCH